MDQTSRKVKVDRVEVRMDGNYLKFINHMSDGGEIIICHMSPLGTSHYDVEIKLPGENHYRKSVVMESDARRYIINSLKKGYMRVLAEGIYNDSIGIQPVLPIHPMMPLPPKPPPTRLVPPAKPKTPRPRQAYGSAMPPRMPPTSRNEDGSPLRGELPDWTTQEPTFFESIRNLFRRHS